MARVVRGGLIQATLCEPATSDVARIKQAMIEKHEGLIAKAAGRGAQIICLQELFYGPYFCTEQDTKWYGTDRTCARGADHGRFADIARKHGIVLVLPVYEEEQTGVYYNTAAVLDADGTTSASFARCTFRRCSRASGRSIISGPAISATRCSRPALPRSASTSAMTGIFPKDWRPGPAAPKSCSILGNGRRSIRVSLEVGTTRPRGRQRLFCGCHQPARLGRAVANR